MRFHKLTRKELKQQIKEDPHNERLKDALEGKCNCYELKQEKKK